MCSHFFSQTGLQCQKMMTNYGCSLFLAHQKMTIAFNVYDSFEFDFNKCLFSDWVTAGVLSHNMACNGDGVIQLCYGKHHEKKALFAVCYNEKNLIPEFTGHILQPLGTTGEADMVKSVNYNWKNDGLLGNIHIIYSSIYPSIHPPIQSLNHQPTNQPINQPINQPFTPPINQSINKSINQLISQSINQSINQNNSNNYNSTLFTFPNTNGIAQRRKYRKLD